MIRKKLLFLTGTRADFGKLKPLIEKCHKSELFETTTFVTGMHMLRKYGSTWEEIKKSGLGNMFTFVNQNELDSIDSILTKTITGISDYIKEETPDLLIVHGDRIEALAGAIAGTLNNIRVAHIEGGEVSGTLDEIIRHSISKMSHFHFVSNDTSKNRLLQMGEMNSRIFVIGSPEVDVMNSENLPELEAVKKRYGISFNEYHIVIFHPVVFELKFLSEQISEIVDLISKSKDNFVIIYPNNDSGSDLILNEYSRLKDRTNIRLIPSMRFEYFLTLLKNAETIIGNSSSGVREAPVFGVPTINIGTRQFNRNETASIFNCQPKFEAISNAIESAAKKKFEKSYSFGNGNTANSFYKVLVNPILWQIAAHKQFIDIDLSRRE